MSLRDDLLFAQQDIGALVRERDELREKLQAAEWTINDRTEGAAVIAQERDRVRAELASLREQRSLDSAAKEILQEEVAKVRDERDALETALRQALAQEGWHTSTGPVEPYWVTLAKQALGQTESEGT